MCISPAVVQLQNEAFFNNTHQYAIWVAPGSYSLSMEKKISIKTSQYEWLEMTMLPLNQTRSRPIPFPISLERTKNPLLDQTTSKWLEMLLPGETQSLNNKLY